VALEGARERATEWIGVRNPSALLYGAIITGTVMSATASHDAGVARILGAVLVVLGIYWMAEVYVRVFTHQLSKGAAGLWHRIGSSARNELAVLLGGVPAVVTFLVMILVGLSVDTAVNVALWVTVAFLGAIAYLAARNVGTPPRTAFLESLFGASLGVLMIIAKGLLH
jgi:hypothetical protein